MDLAEEMITYIDVPCPRILDKIVQGDSIPVQGVEVIAQWIKVFLEIQGTGMNESIILVQSIPVLETKEIVIELPLILKEIRPLIIYEFYKYLQFAY